MDAPRDSRIRSCGKAKPGSSASHRDEVTLYGQLLRLRTARGAACAMIRIERLRFGYEAGGEEVLRLDAFEPPAREQRSRRRPVRAAARRRCSTSSRASCCPSTDASSSPGRIWRRSLRRPATGFAVATSASYCSSSTCCRRSRCCRTCCVAQSIAGLPVDRAGAHATLSALGVDERVHAYPHQLSVGQQQRVAIARRARQSAQAVAGRRADIESRRRGVHRRGRAAAGCGTPTGRLALDCDPRQSPEVADSRGSWPSPRHRAEARHGTIFALAWELCARARSARCSTSCCSRSASAPSASSSSSTSRVAIA